MKSLLQVLISRQVHTREDSPEFYSTFKLCNGMPSTVKLISLPWSTITSQQVPQFYLNEASACGSAHQASCLFQTLVKDSHSPDQMARIIPSLKAAAFTISWNEAAISAQDSQGFSMEIAPCTAPSSLSVCSLAATESCPSTND